MQGTIVLIPVPLVGEIACIVNQLHMYHQINKYLGVKFSKNVMKVLGKFLLSQVSGLVALFAGLAIFKFIPGINIASGFFEAPFAAAINYTCGEIYYAMLERSLEHGLDVNASDETIIEAVKTHAPSKDEIKAVYEDAKGKVKDIDFKSHKAEAESCIEEAEQDKEEYSK